MPPPDAPPEAPLDALPLDEPDVPPEVPADAPVPDVPAPVVPSPVVPPLAPLVPSLPAAPGAVDGRVPRAGGTDDIPEFVLLGLLLRTQSARAVPVRPAHDALGGVSDELAPPDVDGDVLGVDGVADVDDCANAALAATNDATRTSVFNFCNFIEPPEERKNYKRP